jgi:hypothetical protein
MNVSPSLFLEEVSCMATLMEFTPDLIAEIEYPDTDFAFLTRLQAIICFLMKKYRQPG